jgi:YesN/AraC family two-component response regulator
LFGKDREQRLTNIVYHGDRDALASYLDEVTVNTLYRGLSANMKRLYLAHLHTILIRLSAEIKPDVDFKELDKNSAGTEKQYFLSLKEAYINICEQLKKSQKGRKVKLKDSILAYINERYSDCDLNVAALASHFNVAENYFSQFFSEQVGEPFSRYLERTRIEHACKLLKDISLTVDSVAMQSGYNNTNTFRRAFKRITGTTPSDYAKL